jgi:hypothetical protein
MKNEQKRANEFYCEKCDYKCSKKANYERHLKTKKHNRTLRTRNEQKRAKGGPYVCFCGKEYSARNSLWYHKTRCHGTNIVLQNDGEDYEEPSLTKMFMELMNKNQELQDQLLEIAKEPKTVIHNQQNNSFNLNNFLNVQCRDAMNLSEFLEQLQISFQDLLYLGNNGFVDSFKKTFVKQLRDLDQTKRPIHCTDQKRKAMMVKENDKWQKDSNHTMIHSAIDKVNRKQINAFSQHAKNRDKDYLDIEENLDNNSKIIIEMCSYNKQNADDIHKKLLRYLSETTPINKQLSD